MALWTKSLPCNPVIVSRAIGEMRKRLLAQLVLFEFPVILQIHPNLETDWPVVIFSVKWIVEGLPLRVWACMEPRPWHFSKPTSFRNCLGLNVVVYRVAAT